MENYTLITGSKSSSDCNGCNGTSDNRAIDSGDGQPARSAAEGLSYVPYLNRYGTGETAHSPEIRLKNLLVNEYSLSDQQAQYLIDEGAKLDDYEPQSPDSIKQELTEAGISEQAANIVAGITTDDVPTLADYINRTTETVGIDILRRDVVVKRIRTAPMPERDENSPTRGVITELSTRSLQRLRFVTENTDVEFSSIITLTYPNDHPSDGKAVKKHLNRFLTRLRSKYKTNYIWITEFQERGAVHFHIIVGVDLSQLEGGLVKKRRGTRRKSAYHTNESAHDWCAEVWNNIVFDNKYWSPSEEDREKHLKAGISWEQIRKKEGARHYMVKYATKPHQKKIPAHYQNIGRFWGASRAVTDGVTVKKSIPISGLSLTALIGQIDWFGAKFVEQLGYLPKHLYGLGELLLSEGVVPDDELSR